MSLGEKIREYIESQGCGVYFIVLKDEYFFHFSYQNNKRCIVVGYTKNSENPKEQRMISGILRRPSSIREESFSLEIIDNFEAIIPHNTVWSCDKAKEISFTDSGLENLV
ncbi:hypothetical protein HYV50_03605 [Candidatus Pacearchaeota archaeon]|nr:hypothetical protein [Candidatus Pacearchaeota archaeon]